MIWNWYLFIQLGGEQKNLVVDVDIDDDSSATQLQYSTAGSCALSYMQAVTPALTFGGQC